MSKQVDFFYNGAKRFSLEIEKGESVVQVCERATAVYKVKS